MLALYWGSRYGRLALYLPYVQGLFTMTMKTSPLVPVAAYNSYDTDG